MGRTSGPGRFLGCTASLRRASPQHQDADHLWLSGEGGAEIRAPSPSPSIPTPCSLPLSLSHFPSLSITADTCSHFTQDETNHVVSSARCSPAHSQPPPPPPRSRTGRQVAPAKMVKRKSLDDNEPECGKGIPFPIQTFLWRQTRFGVIH